MSTNNEKKYVSDLVSVIIPTYKRFDTLARAINSVKAQTYRPIEILVVDDNEPGDQYSVGVRRLIASMNLANLRLITQEKHINGAAARNAGIEAANGEYVSFLDDDDLWLPEKTEKEVAFIRSLPDEVGAVSCRKVFYHNGEIDHVSEYWEANEKQNYLVITKQLNIQTCTLLIKRICLDQTGYFDPTLRRHQEVQLMGYFTNKYRVEFLNEILTIIDLSDVMNRPDWEKFMEYKNDYFNSIKSIIDAYSAHKKKLIYAHNMTEVAYAKYRDGLRRQGIKELFASIRYPSVFWAFLKRIHYKKTSKNFTDLLPEQEIERVKEYIKICETQECVQ